MYCLQYYLQTTTQQRDYFVVTNHPLVVNKHYQRFDIDVGRPTKWGNPYRTGSRASRIRRYRRYLTHNIALLRDLHTLRGKRLGCTCAPKPCHAHVLATLANLPPLTVLCCGDRYWSQYGPIFRALFLLPKGSHVVHGDCDGADKMCGYVAYTLGHKVSRHPADWKQFGHSAGPRRNQQMLNEHPDISLGIAFHDHFQQSRGTLDMTKRLTKAGIKWVLIQNRLWIPVAS